MQVKERPILFSAPMVRAILEGRKTVTRRPCKPQPSPHAHTKSADGNAMGSWWETAKQIQRCPYGQPGDRLWVRESFWQAGDWISTYPEDDEGHWSGSRRVHYRVDGEPPNEPNHHYPNGLRNGSFSAADPHKIWRARPSIHMPRWASRILLEITEVRVERLQDISEEQAEAEGVDFLRSIPDCDETLTARQLFECLWDSINGASAWDANPWVWAVSFRRVEA
ncbi:MULTISPECIES: hypothetical protein [unclassified Pseudomonas]|uniref:hypothetical protein n=1 Tax=unclassified Pseudomonas TaxID=196821 RepID=UPI000BDA04CF|nr:MULTISPECIES: hypothetical protein [unclassified Pseudomonas]PVZ19970.1 hypothetical protein F474_00561 [Pseudomonas sp. URIL14HWK12:I12]PVZ27036.1 hypothetical protein F470_00216 [Pseudomonas sp. URIL14HWK12:I10]PVZ37925.1 hypothetical protein F472_00561 [Pseudomonas sp. URIL14HWK12:I11]SNZ05118.1 hypothetical protein SAMN05660463_00843 [Pseudomonas sp. URIL14HWK12:I9]